MSKSITVEATAYGPPWNAMEGTGITSTGVNLQSGKQKLVVAVDPRVIPYGTKLKIPNNPFGNPNLIFTASDTGGAIKGNRLDFFVASGRKDQNAWGRRNTKVYIVGKGSPKDVAFLDSAQVPSTLLNNGKKYLPGKTLSSSKTTTDDSAVTSALIDGLLNNRKDLLQVAADAPVVTTTTKTDTNIPGRNTSTLATTAKAPGLGKVTIAGGANARGVTLQKPIMGFLKKLAGVSGRTVTVTTGTNHRQMTTSGNVSDHWDGNAADLGMGGDARQSSAVARRGDLVAAHAIQVAAGVSFKEAYAMAVKGGLWNFNTPQGRVQIIWKTLTGGNHYNHVHVGLNPHR